MRFREIKVGQIFVYERIGLMRRIPEDKREAHPTNVVLLQGGGKMRLQPEVKVELP